MKRTPLQGFTLAEMLVVIAILVATSAGLFTVIINFYKDDAYVLDAATAVESARDGVLRAASNLREASYGDDGAYPLSSAATSTVIFYSDIDNNGSADKVRYYLSGTTLYRGITSSSGNPASYTGQPESTSTVALYVKNATSTPIFTYFNSSGSQLSTTSTNVAQVATVRVELDVDLNPNRAPQIFTLTGSATLRNLRNF